MWSYRVLTIFRNRNIRGNMIHFLTNFLNKSLFEVKINDYLSQKFELENGVPQGSPLSTSEYSFVPSRNQQLT